ncbi:MAG: lipoprotein [Cytophagales bacterium]|nr:lipoprotein [Cytophagales bacterium]MCA6366316.1 lipoprotein [Cytophagales bacterium]MCA6371414.1 lipoprotein [Cytophagales bacterium]MCA6374578.1 lipoprotein [Cytophagales bacterium]MCA6386158.1 lipoprotein [Cytophagales bacterium]
MKKSILFLLVAATLSSCAFENYKCPAYGSNGPTKHGLKAQKSYSKRRL